MSSGKSEHYSLQVGARFSLSFQRTLRIPDDGKEYPLPPGLGAFRIFRARDYIQCPEKWRKRDELFISMYQREAVWIGMRSAAWKPNVVQIGLGDINAVTGMPWSNRLTGTPQNYLVCPPQPWLDGINAGEGRIRQFVAMPVGSGYTVEGQISTKTEAGGLRIAVYEPVPGRFPDEAPPVEPDFFRGAVMSAPAMGLGAGGTMRQKIYPDPYGLDAWQQEPLSELRIHIVNSAMFHELTNEAAPTTPISAREYTKYGLPWFDLYDDDKKTLDVTSKLSTVKSVHKLDDERAVSDMDNSTVTIPSEQIWKLT